VQIRISKRLGAVALSLACAIVTGAAGSTMAPPAAALAADPVVGDPPLPYYDGLVTGPPLTTMAVAHTTPVGNGCGNNGSNKTLSRDEVITRAETWFDVTVPYSQTRCYENQYGDYRTDCSGYVSMAWGLGGSGSSHWTGNLMNVASTISRSSLKKGDALLRHTGDPHQNHVALFVKWADSAHTKPVVMEQSGSGTFKRTWSANNAGLYTPIRYDNIIDSTPPQSDPIDPAGAALAYDKGDGTMRIYRWTSDDTTFDRATDYDSGSFSLASVGNRMASGDVNGDGKADIVMAYQRSDGTFAYYVWLNGNGAAQVWYTSGAFNLANVAGRLVVDDFNGDGKAEPAMAYDQGDGTMRIYRWLSTGSAFGRTGDYDSGSFHLGSVGDRMASGDVNGDGKADIVMAYQLSDGTFAYYVWLNGNGAAQVWYTSGAFNLANVAGRLVVEDFNGDGKAEPAMTYDQGDGTMRIYRWKSDGRAFGRTTDYDSGSFHLSSVGDRMASADVNADGDADIVMAYQRSDGTFGYYIWLGGNSAAQVWYTSGPFNLDNAAGRLVLGNW
jgi:hypothetical protein